MGRRRASQAVIKRDGVPLESRFALQSVVSEASLPALREATLRERVSYLAPDGTKREGTAEEAYWFNTLRKALGGNRTAGKKLDKLWYGWTDRDADLEERIRAALGVSVDEARAAVLALAQHSEATADDAARQALAVLRWYMALGTPTREVIDGVHELAALAARHAHSSADLVTGEAVILQD